MHIWAKITTLDATKNKAKRYKGKNWKVKWIYSTLDRNEQNCTFQKPFFFFSELPISYLNSEFSFLFSFFYFQFQALVLFSLIQFSLLFFFLSLALNLWREDFHRSIDFFFSLPVGVSFSRALNCFKGGTPRNLSFFVKFLPLFFSWQKMSPKTRVE